MQQPGDVARPAVLDLDDLELDPMPAFVIKVSIVASQFEIIFANEAFRTRDFRNHVLSHERAALTFRTWTQSYAQSRDSRHEFASCTWSGERMERSGLKLIKVVYINASDQVIKADHQPVDEDSSSYQEGPGQSPSYKQYKANPARVPRNVTAANISARLESFHTMMEMSDVGVFEYNTDGALLHANEAFYKLRSVSLSNEL
jgi:hypothetical protein